MDIYDPEEILVNVYDAVIARKSRRFTHIEQWYKHASGMLYSDGVKWLATQLNADWLIDQIALYSKKFWKQAAFLEIEVITPIIGRGSLNIRDSHGRCLQKLEYGLIGLFINKDSFGRTKRKRKKAKLRFFLIYRDDCEKFVLTLPSEY